LLTDVLSEALAKGNGDTDKSSGPRLILTGVDCRNNSFLSVNKFKTLSHRLLNICHAYNLDTRSFIASWNIGWIAQQRSQFTDNMLQTFSYLASE